MPGAEAAGQAAGAEDATKPAFNGVVNGIYIWSRVPPTLSDLVKNDASIDQRPCTGNEARNLGPDEGARNPYYFDVPPYMLPGAWADGPTVVQVCNSGELLYVGRGFHFEPQGGWLNVVRLFSISFARIGSTSEDRIETGTVNGKSAVFVKPVTPEGWGESDIIIRETWGLSIVSARDIPFDDVLKIAASME